MSEIIPSPLISEDKLSSLKDHLTAYGLSAFLPILGDAIGNAEITEVASVYTVALGNSFLNTGSTPLSGLSLNSGNDFLFWITVKTSNNEFAEYFPEILPSDPWLVADAASLPFPNLASVTVEDIEWSYLYFSTEVEAKQAALYIPYSVTSKLSLEKLKKISGKEYGFDGSPIAWHGGLYYKGNYNMPWNLLIPAGTPWHSLVPGSDRVPVYGCTYRQQVFSFLKLRVLLLSNENPFGEGEIKKIALTFELTSSLSGQEPTERNSIGLSGSIQIGNSTEIAVTGTWPLNRDDDILINANCALSQINAYFDNHSIAGISLPDNITAAIVFHFSKTRYSLSKISFGLSTENWVVSAGIFELQKVLFDVSLISPAKENLILARFNAKAKIGNTLSVICSGNYPGADFNIGLDPSIPLRLSELVHSISGIPDIFPDGLEISELCGSYNSTFQFYSLNATVTEGSDFQPGETGFKLKNISASISKGQEFSCSLNATFEIDYTGADSMARSMLFKVSSIYSGSWFFNASYTGNISIADVAAAFGFSEIPEFLDNCVFTSINLIFDSGSGYKLLNGNVRVKVDDKSDVILFLQISLLTVNGKTTVNFCGDFTLIIEKKSLHFHVDIDKNADGSDDLKFSILFKVSEETTVKLEAESKSASDSEKVSEKFFSGSASGLNVSLTDALSCLIQDMAGISLPVELPQLMLTSIACTYDGKNSVTNLIASGTIGGRTIKFIFYYGKRVDQATGATTDVSRYAFGLQADISSLGGLPIVGEQLEDVKILNFGFIYTSEAGEYSLPALAGASGRTNAAAGHGLSVKLSKGFNFSGELQLPGEAGPFQLTLPTVPAMMEGSPASLLNNTPAQPSIQAATKWFRLDKKLGPVTVGQVGFMFQDGSLELLISGSLTVASLTLSLNGLGISFLVDELFKEKIYPSFHLAGIGVQYSAPPVQVAATFLHSVDKQGNNVYSGTALIKASKFTISALGSYTQVQDQTSLFIYGLHEGAIGGPVFFFVTGIAAGFGYNRKVNVPPVNEVAEFPLVALAISPEPKSLEEILTSLDTPMLNGKTPIEISLGDYWLAVGVKFTSFKIIESFVLVTVNLGTQLEFSILGLSKLSWPEKSIAPAPIVYIELAVLAHFGPGSDVISVDAIITTNSYLLSKECRLTGGFAFYTWVSGTHEGDFVITLGGYHPKFIKPDHYPTVPRLGLRWKVSDSVMITGEMYFAITPSAIMAGGRWEVLFQVPVITVYVTVWADMLIYWTPYQYSIDIGICVKIDANIKISFIRIHFSLEMNAELHIWGPPFAGEAYVDWAIFSFTIPFGSSERTEPASLNWQQFSNGFIPHSKQAVPAAHAAKSLADPAPPLLFADPINIMISHGIIDIKTDTEGQEKFAVLNPHQLAIAVDSFIPVTRLTLNGKEASDAVYTTRNREVGIPSCGFSMKDTIEMLLDIRFSLAGTSENMSFSALTKGFTEALWGGTKNTSSNNSPGSSMVLKNIISGMAISPLPLPQVSRIREYDFSKLFEKCSGRFTWSFCQVKAGPAYHSYQMLGYTNMATGEIISGILEKTYSSKKVASSRTTIMSFLKAEFDDSLECIDEEQMTGIMKLGSSYFRAAPVLCGIGEVPQYSTDTI